MKRILSSVSIMSNDSNDKYFIAVISHSLTTSVTIQHKELPKLLEEVSKMIMRLEKETEETGDGGEDFDNFMKAKTQQEALKEFNKSSQTIAQEEDPLGKHFNNPSITRVN